VVGAGFGLVAVELARFAERFLVEPVAVGVEMILDEIFVPGDVVFVAERFDRFPGRRFDFEAFDVQGIVFML